MKEDQLKILYDQCLAELSSETGKNYDLVTGYGNYNADIMFISEYPGEKEEELGQPLVGKSSDRFNDILDLIQVTKEEVYTTNIVKYRPCRVNEITGSLIERAPKKDEIDFFMPYLLQEIEIIRPQIIVTLGNSSLKALLDDPNLKIKDEHGIVRDFFIKNKKVKLVPLFHPSSSHYSSSSPNQKIEDVQAIKDLLQKRINRDQDVSLQSEYTIQPKQTIMETTPVYQELDTSVKKQNVFQSVFEKTEEPSGSSKSKVIIVYGGDGYADDPNLVVIDRIAHVLTELNTSILRIDLYKQNYSIQDFFHELKDTKSVVLATTVEWIGIGGHMQMFLDQCWQYGNKELFKDVYLFGVVISRQGYERDTYNHLIKSWELLGGVEGEHICSCIKTSVDLETNRNLLETIEKKVEQFYRLSYQSRVMLPTSIRMNKVYMEVPTTPNTQESGEIQENQNKESTSAISHYDEYMEKQQKDIADLANLFKKKIGNKTQYNNQQEPDIIIKKYKGDEDIQATIQWDILDQNNKSIIIQLKQNTIKSYLGQEKDLTLTLQSKNNILTKILNGNLSIQRAFMTGEIKAKGDFSVLYKMDNLFEFNQ